MTVLHWAFALWIAGMLLGITGFAAWVALMTTPGDDTPWLGRAVYRFGQAVIVAAMLLCAGLFVAAGIAAGMRVFG